MLSHRAIWEALDALAERHGLSTSGLAKLAGLDATAFNPSKRVSKDGRERWPSTESIAKVLEATNETFDSLLSGAVSYFQPPSQTDQGTTVPLLGFGYTLAHGAIEAVKSEGILGAFTGGVTAAAAGIAAAVFFGYLAALIFKPKMKK